MMENNFIEEDRFIRAKKRVKEMKDFYIHLMVYVLVNIFISAVIIFGLTSEENHTFSNAISNFGVYSTWVFWGIGIFFHWLSAFGFNSFGLGKDWEEKKIKELMEKEQHRRKNSL